MIVSTLRAVLSASGVYPALLVVLGGDASCFRCFWTPEQATKSVQALERQCFKLACLTRRGLARYGSAASQGLQRAAALFSTSGHGHGEEREKGKGDRPPEEHGKQRAERG